MVEFMRNPFQYALMTHPGSCRQDCWVYRMNEADFLPDFAFLIVLPCSASEA